MCVCVRVYAPFQPVPNNLSKAAVCDILPVWHWRRKCVCVWGGGGQGHFLIGGGNGMFVPPPPPTHTHTFNPTFLFST